MGERYVTIGRREEGEAYSPRGYGSRPVYDTARTIYVGQLRYDTDERTVRKWFEAYGNVAAVKLIYDKETGRSKGFGFVTFEDDRDARDALNDASGRDLDGAAIKVNVAHGPASMGAPFGGRGRGRGGFHGGRGPYAYRGRGFDRRADDHYSPGRYSPRSRSRSRSPGRKHDRDSYGDEEERGDKRRRQASPSRSRSRASSGRSESRSRSRSSDRSRSGTPASQHRSPARTHTDNDGAATAPPTAEPAGSLPPAPAAITPPVAPAPEQTPPGMGVASAAPASGPIAAAPRAPGSKPPPSAEAIKKELLRLRRQEQELGSRVRSLQEDLERKERQLAARDAELAEAQQALEELHPQLAQYKQWVAALLSGAGELATSRKALAAAEAEAKRKEEKLAALQRDIAAEAERAGAELANGVGQGHHGQEDDDEAWERLAADIQESEREAAAAAKEGERRAGREPAGGMQAQASDMALQAVMQDAAMEEDEPAGAGWTQAGGEAHRGANGGRFEGMKFAVPA